MPRTHPEAAAVLLLFWLQLLAPHPAAGILWGSSCTKQFVEEPTSRCAFPSLGPVGSIDQCQSGTGGWWCPTTHNYCTDGAYRWCPGTDTTYGGNSPGSECRFPFWYKGIEYRHCVRLDTLEENYLWCSTTPGNYSGRWTRCRELPALMPCRFLRSVGAASAPSASAAATSATVEAAAGIDSSCVRLSGVWSCRTALGDTRPCEETPTTEGGNDPGRACRFPFKLEGVPRTGCVQSQRLGDISDEEEGDYGWCATTDDFDRDRLWTRCKPQPPRRLSGLPLLLVAAAGVVAAACAAACLLYCLCEPAAPCRRVCRQCRRRRSPAGSCLGVDVDKATTSSADRHRPPIRWQQRRRLIPTAPPSQSPLPPPRQLFSLDDRQLGGGPPSYEEVLALARTAARDSGGAAAPAFRDIGVPV